MRTKTTILIICITAGYVLGQDKAKEGTKPATTSVAPAKNTNANHVRYRLFYQNLDPKNLFTILQNTYHVLFEGVDTVTGPISLISGEDMVDLAGMLKLLNEVLVAQDKIAKQEGQIIKISPRKRSFDYFIELKHAEPDKVLKIIKELFEAKEDKPEERAKKAEYIQVHPSLKGLIVRGSEEVHKQIQDYIKTTQIDVAPAGTEGTTKPPTPPTPEGPLFREYVALDFMDPAEFQALIEQDQTLKDKCTTVVARNTLIVFSREEDVFARVKEMKKAFDVDRLEIRYLPLANAKADEIAGLIKQIYPPKVTAEEAALPPELADVRREGTDEPGVLVELRQGMTQMGVAEPRIEELLSGAISVLAAGEVVVVPDKIRNALLIRTHSRNFPKILELIKELDIPLRQVMIDVFITEVTLDDSIEFGVDFTYTHNEHTNTFKQLFQGTTQKPAGSPSPVGISYQLIDDNITAYIRALQATKKLDVISRPQIVTKDNNKANIALGRDVPNVTQTKISTEGAISSAVSYIKVQTVLDVTPHIHPDDYVTLDIMQTIDDVSAETFQISANFNPQVLIRRSAKTAVRVKDGQTVCFGGFVGDQIIENEDKIPILGDLPLVGVLFKFTSRQRVKTELMIFITPHILQTPQEMLRMTNEMRRRSNSSADGDRESTVLEPQRFLEYPPYREPLPEFPIPQDVKIIDKPPVPPEQSPTPPEDESKPEEKPKPKTPTAQKAPAKTPAQAPSAKKPAAKTPAKEQPKTTKPAAQPTPKQPAPAKPAAKPASKKPTKEKPKTKAKPKPAPEKK